ncbi:MAG: SRPBCC domain-containing protein [Betaproteobacteria bacterium]|nr:SRPBCC domain-containing protein [Betaproteobacteria bacterium]
MDTSTARKTDMPEICHRIEIKAPPAKVYYALIAAPGLKGWWTGDVVAEPKVGSIAEFGFSNRSTLFRMKIAELKPMQRVVWECVGDVDEWTGTRIIWEISAQGDASELRLTHSGWRSKDGWYGTCDLTWGELMYRLRDYVEGKDPGPYFSGTA